jgi:hypothetical protein
MKKCTKCGEQKPLSEFTIRSDTKKHKNTCRSCVKIYSKNNHLKNSNKRKNQKLQKAYGISLDEKLVMFGKQHGKCEICQIAFSNLASAHVDHCHTTGKIRGLLCTKCNPGIGFFEDCLDKLKAAQVYLEKYNSELQEK